MVTTNKKSIIDIYIKERKESKYKKISIKSQGTKAKMEMGQKQVLDREEHKIVILSPWEEMVVIRGFISEAD